MRPILGTSIVFAALMTTPLVGQIKVGDRAPKIETSRLLNTRTRSLSELEGRLILFVYLDLSDEPGTKAVVKHVDNLLARFGRKGFESVAILTAALPDVQRWIGGLRPRMAVALERGSPSFDLFGFASSPASFLVGPKSDVAWIGNPRDLSRDDVEIALRKVRAGFPAGQRLWLSATLPKPFGAIVKQMEAGELGAAHEALTTALSKPGLNEVDEALLSDARRSIEDLLGLELADADRAVEVRRYFEALSLWRRVSRHFAELPAATKAGALAAELENDPKAAPELETGRRIAEAEDLLLRKKTKDAVKVLEEVLAGPLKETREARRAQALLEELRQG